MPKKPHQTDILGLVGWVFADLLLALTVVFIATQPGNPEAGAQIAPEEQPTTTTSTVPPSTTTTVPPGVDSEFFCFVVRTDPEALRSQDEGRRTAQIEDLKVQTLAGLAFNNASDRRAGIVLTFGVAADAGQGKEFAQLYNDAVLPSLPEVFSGSDGAVTANRAFWAGGPNADKPTGAVEVNVYPLTDAAHPPLPKDSGQPC